MADAVVQKDNVTDIQEHKARKARAFATAPIGATETIRRRLDRTPAQFSEDLGYSDSTYPGWVRVGRLPKTAALAAEALMRRQASDAAGPTYLVRTVKGAPMVHLVDATRVLVLDGRRYLLVEDAQ